MPTVVATPHVAASTEEAQALVAREAAEQVLEVLSGGRPRWPVNVPALTREELDALGPFLPLAERLGRLQAALLSAPPRQAAVYVRGGGAEEHLDIVGGHFLAGVLGALSDEPVNYVNAPVIAAERGLQMSHGVAADTRGYSRYVRASVTDGEGPVEVAGAVLDRGQARIVEIAGFGLDLVPSDTVLLILNSEPDRPGFIGTVGRILGDAGISILGIQVGREVIDRMGLMAVSVRGAVASDVRKQIAAQQGVTRLEIVRFEDPT
jgi:D-3-phosphoglycerate dehydrogenase